MKMTNNPPTYSTPLALPEGPESIVLPGSAQDPIARHIINPAGGPLAMLAQRNKRPLASEDANQIVLPPTKQSRFSNGTPSSHANYIFVQNTAEGDAQTQVIRMDSASETLILEKQPGSSASDNDIILSNKRSPKHLSLAELPEEAASSSSHPTAQTPQTTNGLFDQLPEELVIRNIFYQLPLEKVGQLTTVSKQFKAWAEKVPSCDSRTRPPRFSNLTELGEFFIPGYQYSKHYALAQLHQMVALNQAPNLHIPTIEQLLEKRPEFRTLRDLKKAGLLNREQIEEIKGVKLNAQQIRYLTSDRIILALMQRIIRPDLQVLSRIPIKYLTLNLTGGTLLNIGILKAIQDQRQEVVERMIKSDLFVKITDGFGVTPLHDAILLGKNKETLQLLLDAGATHTINWQTNLGHTALHHAVSSDDPEIIPLLIQRGAAINIQNDEGDTPLHLVVRRGDQATHTVKLFLLTAGGMQALNIKNKRNKTPVDLALSTETERGSHEVVRLLCALGGQTADEVDQATRLRDGNFQQRTVSL